MVVSLVYVYLIIDVPQPLAIRLSGSNSFPWIGYVEVDVYSNDKVWGSVCSRQWSIEDVRVVCNQLGYLSTIAAITHPIFGPSKRDPS